MPMIGYLDGAMGKTDLAIGIGGAAGQGIATPGDILARIFVRRGLHLNTYNAYQSIIRGGHIFLTLRTSAINLSTPSATRSTCWSR